MAILQFQYLDKDDMIILKYNSIIYKLIKGINKIRTLFI